LGASALLPNPKTFVLPKPNSLPWPVDLATVRQRHMAYEMELLDTQIARHDVVPLKMKKKDT
jgi:hypothetical protein